MEQHVTIVPNSRPAYVAEPEFGGENSEVTGVVLTPIVAWRVEYDVGHKAGSSSTAIPVTTEFGLPSNYAIYFSDTDKWNIPDGEASKGIGELAQFFRENVVVDGA